MEKNRGRKTEKYQSFSFLFLYIVSQNKWIKDIRKKNEERKAGKLHEEQTLSVTSSLSIYNVIDSRLNNQSVNQIVVSSSIG